MPVVMFAGFLGDAVSVGNALTGRGGLSLGQETMKGAASV